MLVKLSLMVKADERILKENTENAALLYNCDTFFSLIDLFFEKQER